MEKVEIYRFYPGFVFEDKEECLTFERFYENRNEGTRNIVSCEGPDWFYDDAKFVYNLQCFEENKEVDSIYTKGKAIENDYMLTIYGIDDWYEYLLKTHFVKYEDYDNMLIVSYKGKGDIEWNEKDIYNNGIEDKNEVGGVLLELIREYANTEPFELWRHRELEERKAEKSNEENVL